MSAQVMKKWSVTIVTVCILTAASATAKAWAPQLLKLLDVQGNRIQALANLIQVVIWTGVALVALIALWRRQQDNSTQKPLPITSNNQHPTAQASEGDLAVSIATPLGHEKVSIARLPVTGHDLFGREAELKLLDDAWANSATNVVVFVAWGGVGKSALVNAWLRRMARDHYRGAERVFAWSFYSQGTSDQRAASADLFIDAALRWFGDADPTLGSPWDKGERLAQLIRQSRTLLLLDGLEPLQHPPNRAGQQEGRLKDQAMQALLRELAAQQSGLCIVSTRLRVSDLEDFEQSSVSSKDLGYLSPQAGAQILRAQSVTGDDADLEKASEEFGGHARRVMASYENWLGEGPELAVLRMLGLFDRPADAAAINVLRAAPAIPGLTEALQNLKEREWQQTLSKLRRIKLLAGSDVRVATDFSLSPPLGQTKVRPTELDAHPLVREHFGQQMKRDHPDAWREANLRLYEHLTRSTKELPDSIEQIMMLYAAIVHGCEAGRHQESIDHIYRRRIQREPEFYCSYTFGIYGADYAVLSRFFDKSSKPIAGLSASARAFVMKEIGYCLRALGQLEEASWQVRGALDDYIAQEDWENTFRCFDIIINLFISIGRLGSAEKYALQSVELADRGDNAFYRMYTRTALADVLHQLGNTQRADSLFLEAESIPFVERARNQSINSYAVCQYCDFLLSQGRYQEVQNRVETELQIVLSTNVNPLAMALIHLVLGRAYLVQTHTLGREVFTQTADHLRQSVSGFRKIGRQDHLPRALLARAELHRIGKEYSFAHADLDEVFRIATRGSMRLYLTDCHLERARLCLAQAARDKAREHWATAKAMVEQTGYHRRDRDVTKIEQQLNAGAIESGTENQLGT